MNVKIIGAGSIGNHLAQASRRMGWNVVMVDADSAALLRMKSDIYPKRYGAWDNAIQLFEAGKEPKHGFDIIMIGTPPDSRMKLAHAALSEKPRLLHLEKPLSTPDLAGVSEFVGALEKQSEIMVTVGYDHAVAESVEFVCGLAIDGTIGHIQTIDVEFREHWKGIFGAHPWLAGPWETYLGYWKRGGGAGGEHSHALHLWLYFARVLGWGGVKNMQAVFDMVKGMHGEEYDRLAAFLLTTEQNGIGRVIQDVITYPVRKWARLQGEKGFVEWHCNGSSEGDLVKYQVEGAMAVEKVFCKKRPDDFFRETTHYVKLLSGEIKFADSPLSFDRGLEVMKILNASYYNG